MAAEKSELRKILDKLRPYAGLMLGLSVVVGILGITPIAYMREVYGPVVTARSEHTLVWVTLLLVLALALAGTLEWVRQRIQSAAATRLMGHLGTRALEVSFEANLQGRKSANAALNDLRVLKNFLVSPIFATFFEVPVGFLFLGLIYFINPLMGTISIVGGVLMLVIGILAERAARPLNTASMDAASRASTMAIETTRNAQAIEAMGMAPAVLNRWGAVQSQFMVLNAQAGNKQALGASVSKAIMLIQGSSMIGVGTALTLLGHISPAAAGLFIVAKFIGAMAMRPFMTLIMGWRQIDMARQALYRLEESLALYPTKAVGLPLPRPQGHLIVTNAYVRPPGSKATVLQSLTFDLHPGQILVVMGASGSGKSSLAKLVTGLWPCSVGEARLDGVSVAGWNKEELGQYLGYLPQDVELFDGTIRDNICRFGDFNPQEYARVIALTGLDELFANLPQQDLTELGPVAATLSGGQRQRVGLARALYGSPQLIVLDEPNSNLDLSGDIALWNALNAERSRGATIVLITHRTEVIKLADRVLILKDGKPALFGSADQVKDAFDKVNAKLQPKDAA
jgi:ATP-binding cassette subfamily C exporter for protease/lipase